jgi:hypothetical protein
LVNAQKVTYNYIIDTSDVEVKKVKLVFENYIHSRPDSIYFNPYWSSIEKQSPYHFDILYGEFQPSLYMGFPIHVLSIKMHNEAYEIKAMFSACKTDGTPYVLCIANYYAVKEDGEFKLSNALYRNREKWAKSKIGLITFYYPYYHQFDSTKAEALNSFSINLCHNLDLDTIEYEYYFADDFDELQILKGLDYWLGMGGKVKPTGRGGNGRVFCSGLGENYFHEPFHVLSNVKKYKAHLWAAEGVATYLGGSRGKTIEWHICKVNNYLIIHQNIDLSKNLLQLRTLDEYTDFRYAIGGLIAKRVYEKGGWNYLKLLLNCGYSDDEYYYTIEKLLGIKRTMLNQYLRNEIKKECLRN